jgi:V/A-type H+-transporting ATPase subunit E
MGCKELIESLRASGDGKVRALRAEAEQEADRVRAEAAKRIEAIRERHLRDRQAAAAKQTEAVLAKANEEARRIRIRSERDLANRLAGLARASLSSLRNVGYGDVFVSFIHELPPFPWKTVRVSPADVDLAKTHFPDAEIAPDKDISGGLVVVSEGERVRVVNTFEKRLERKWEDMLPEIIAEVREQSR